MYVYNVNHYYDYALPTAVPAVLADPLLHGLFSRDGYELEHVQQCVSGSVQSSDAFEQVLQGKKQQQQLYV